MRKQFLLVALCGLFLLTTNAVTQAQEFVNKEDMVRRGFSPYLADIAILQEKKHESKPYEIPGKIRTYFKHVTLNGDFLIPTQEFGYYEIKNHD